MRILHLVAPGDVGGLERVVQALAEGHRGQGLDVHVAVFLHGGNGTHALVEALAAACVPVHRFDLPPRAYRHERAAVRHLCDDLRPDVVHTHGYRPDVLHAPVARRLAIPTVTTVHGFTGGGLKMRTYEWLQVRALRRFDAVVAVSHPLAHELRRRGVPDARLHTVLNAWRGDAAGPALARETARQRLGIPAGAFHIGWVGRLSREKGADVLVQALARLFDVPFVASVVGDGPERPALAARAAALGLDGQVRWQGTLSDAARYFAAFDVFVLSSRTEGTPLVLLEAMAAGVPIVAAPVGGVPDVVTAGEAHFAAPDDPASLAAAVRSVFLSPVPAAQRAEAARGRLAQRFALEPFLARYHEVYRGLRDAP